MNQLCSYSHLFMLLASSLIRRCQTHYDLIIIILHRTSPSHLRLSLTRTRLITAAAAAIVKLDEVRHDLSGSAVLLVQPPDDSRVIQWCLLLLIQFHRVKSYYILLLGCESLDVELYSRGTHTILLLYSCWLWLHLCMETQPTLKLVDIGILLVDQSLVGLVLLLDVFLD